MNLKQLIPFGFGLEEFIALGAAVFVGISIVVVWRGLLEKAPAQRRIKAIVERRATLRQALVAPKRRGRAETLNVARRTLRYFRLMTGKPVENARSKLIRAGFRSRDAVTLFLFAKLCLPVVLGVLVVVMAYVVELYDLAPRTRLSRVSKETLAIDGKASPRNPKLVIRSRPSSDSFEVACRSSARRISAGGIPQPSSVTSMSSSPPATSLIRIIADPASRAFSTSSLRALAGRSTTSPAAMRFTSSDGSLLIDMLSIPSRLPPSRRSADLSRKFSSHSMG